MTKDEVLKLALEAFLMCSYLKLQPHSVQQICDRTITAIKEVLAQPEQEPVAFPRQAGKSTWTVDTAFIWRVKHTIDPDTPNDFTPSEEQIETVLLALEKIPSKLYTTPPTSKPWVGLTDEEMDTEADKKEQGYGFIQGALWAEDKLKEKNL